MEFSSLLKFAECLSGNEASRPVIDALRERLGLMAEIGLDYLSFERRIDSLSGGEYQRLRIANQVGSELVGLTYIIDEPADGLHGADSRKVIAIIRRLLSKGNTVITIEHDYDVIRAADHIIEMGPGAGSDGGRVIAEGTLREIRDNPESMIGRYLVRKPKLGRVRDLPGFDASIRLLGVEANNVKNVDVEIHLGRMTCFTGVSDSGKSSIVHEVLYKACYSRLHDHRVIPGKYRSIEGVEQIKNVICVDQSLLNGKYRGKNIKQVLDMTFAEAVAFFEGHEAICRKAGIACDLGLGYLRLGQSLHTVSGGEAQRLKFAREMSRKSVAWCKFAERHINHTSKPQSN